SSGDDAAADTGGGLDEQQVLRVGPGGEVLAEGHDVDVVVHQHRHGDAAADVLGDVEAVPAGHDRRVDRASGGVLDRAGEADADAQEVGLGPPRLVEELASSLDHPVQDGLG